MRISTRSIVGIFALVIVGILTLGAQTASAGAALTTDKGNYTPGETVVLTGSGFWPTEDVTVQVLEVPDANTTSPQHQPWTVKADTQGGFVTYWFVNEEEAGLTLQATATGGASGLIAKVAFVDGPPPDGSHAAVGIEQCRNGGINTNGTLKTPVACSGTAGGGSGYVTGNAGGSNSHWQEGEFISYRAILTNLASLDLPGSDPLRAKNRLRIQWDITKDNVHAIDYIGSFDATELAAPTTGNALHANQNDPCSDFVTGCAPGTPNGVSPAIPAFDLDFSDNLVCGSAAAVAVSQIPGSIKAWNADFDLDGNGLADDLNFLVIQENFGTSQCTTSLDIFFRATHPTVILAWGGHIASQADWGVGKSATGISGSPYHMRVIGQDSGAFLNLSVGNQDRSLSTDAITQTITVNKVCGTSTNSGNFVLHVTDNNALDPQTAVSCPSGGTTGQVFVNVGSFTVSETVGASTSLSNYDTDIVCTDPLYGTTTSNGGWPKDPAGHETTLSAINVDAGHNVTCTITNTLKTGSLIVRKTSEGGTGGFTFNVTHTAGGTDIANFTVTTTIAGTPASSTTYTVNAADYTIDEIGSPSTQWTFISVTCVDHNDIANTDTTVINNSASEPVTVTVAPAHTLTCTFLDRKRAKVTLIKVCLPAVDSTDFTYKLNDADIPGSLNCSNQPTSGTKVVLDTANASDFITYSITENIPDTDVWAVTTASCVAVDGDLGPLETGPQGPTGIQISNPFHLDAGDDIECTFTNVKKAKITVTKVCITSPEDTTTQFNFTAQKTGSDEGGPVPATCGGPAVTMVGPTGSATNLDKIWTIKENTTSPTGWDLTNISCTTDSGLKILPTDSSEPAEPNFDPGDDRAAILLNAGDQINCTFTNTKRGKIIVKKEVDIGGDISKTDPQNFTFDPLTGLTPDTNFELDDDPDVNTPQTKEFANVKPGTYTVKELDALGWQLISITCDDAAGATDSSGDTTTRVATFKVDPGETVTCTFQNHQADMPVKKRIDTRLSPSPCTGAGEAQCDDPVMGNVYHKFPFELYLGTGYDGSPDVPTFLPPGFDAQGVIGVPLTMCETIPDGWKPLAEGDVTLVVSPTPDPAIDLTPPVTTPTGAPSDLRCFDVTIPNGTNTFEIRINNTPLSKLIITKQTLPDASQQSFTFTPTGYNSDNTFPLSDGLSNGSATYISGGAKTVTETVPPMWDLTNISCTKTVPSSSTDPDVNTSTIAITGEDPPAAGFHKGDNKVEVGLQNGATVSCTFENTERGNIQIVKKTKGGVGAFDFNFTGGPTTVTQKTVTLVSGDCDSGTAVCTKDTGLIEVKPGSYTIDEDLATVPAGTPTWNFISVTCDDGTPGDTSDDDTVLPAASADGHITVSVEAGETVICTYNNVRDAEMPVIKRNDLGEAITSGPPNFTLLLYPGPKDSATNPGGYDATDTDSPIKGSAVQLTLPFGGELPIELGAGSFDASFCETGFPAGWTFESWKVTIDLFIGADIVLDTAGTTPTLTTFTPEPGSMVCVFFSIPQGAELVTMEITNNRPGSLKITKDAIPDTTLNFGYTGSGTGIPATFTLDDDASEGDAGCTNNNDCLSNQTFTNLAAESAYRVAETTISTWDLTNITCNNAAAKIGRIDTSGQFANGGNDTFDAGDNVVDISSLPAGAAVECTFTNRRRPRIQVIKACDPTNDPGRFDLFVNWFNNQTSPSISDQPCGGQTANVFVSPNANPPQKVAEKGNPGLNGDPTSLSSYTTTLNCTTTGAQDTWTGFPTSVLTPDTDGIISYGLPRGLDYAEDVTCTFTNTRRGSLKITKDAIPNDAQDFTFTGSGTGVDASFSLDDDQGATGESTTLITNKLFSNLAAGGAYRVAETLPVNGWDLTGMTCNNAAAKIGRIVSNAFDNGGNDTFDAGDNVVDISSLPPAANVECTYTNTKRATITVSKACDPNTDITTPFTFTTQRGADSVTTLTDFAKCGESLVTIVGPTSAAADLNVNWTIGESSKNGWDLTNIVCTTDSGLQIGTATTDDDFDAGDSKAIIHLDAGDNVNCTYTNRKQGSLKITKDAIPNDAQDFGYTGTGTGVPASFKLDDDGSEGDAACTTNNNCLSNQTFSNLAAGGAYRVAETLPVTGWDLTGMTCNNAAAKIGRIVSNAFDNGGNDTFDAGDNVVDISNLPAAANVECTYTNTKDAILRISKTTIYGFEKFDYTTTGGWPSPAVSGNFSLTTISVGGTDSKTFTFPALPAAGAVKTVTESSPPNGWVFTSLACARTADSTADTDTYPNHLGVNSDPPQPARTASIHLDPGDDITCAYTNTKQATITLIKDCDPRGDTTTLFPFTVAGQSIDPLKCGNQRVVVGPTVSQADFKDWTINEGALPSGWSLKDIVCTGAGEGEFVKTSTGATVGLDGGEDIVCTFTNEQVGGRFTGGGSFFTRLSPSPTGVIYNDIPNVDGLRITHGFELHCNAAVLPNRLEVNWDGPGQNNQNQQNFHLTNLTNALCYLDPHLNAKNPRSGINTYEGWGEGQFNNISGAHAHWIFTDNGEPGTKDEVWIVIKDSGGTVVLQIGGTWDSAQGVNLDSDSTNDQPMYFDALAPGTPGQELDGANLNSGNQQAHK